MTDFETQAREILKWVGYDNDRFSKEQALADLTKLHQSALQQAQEAAHLQEIEMLRDAMKFGGDVNTKSWMSFDFEGYFNERLAALRNGGKG